MAQAEISNKRIVARSSSISPESHEHSGTVSQAIDNIAQLENLTYDLYGLTKSVATQFETHVELSPGANPKNPTARLIDPQALESMVYLVQRSADIAEELNAKLHNAVQQLTKPANAVASSAVDDGDVWRLCLAVRTLSSVIADQLAHPQGPPVRGDYGLDVAPFNIDACMLRYAADHAAELALDVRDQIMKR